MKPTEHSIFDSVKVGVFNGHFITAFKYFGVIVDAKKGIESVGSHSVGLCFVSDRASFEGSLRVSTLN